MQVSALVLFLAALIGSDSSKVSITFPQASDPDNYVKPQTQEPNTTTENTLLKEIVRHIANLGLKTLRDLFSGPDNVIISPLNVYSCLGILSLGAAGETKEELRRVLGPAPGSCAARGTRGSPEGVSYASALFLDHGFVPRSDFVKAVAGEFEASVRKVNASNGEEARRLINSWVSEQTNGTIAELLQGRLDPDTKMVVVSALLFRGKWLHSFPTAATAPGKFEAEGGPVDVPLMHLLASVPLVRDAHFDAISLPYIDARGMTMHVLLPRAHGAPALANLLSHLNANSLKKLRKEAFNEEIFIVLPKMNLDSRLSLTHPLKKQGIAAMFNPAKANFTACVEDGSGLFVSQIYHSLHFEMDEEGTVASAATAAILTKSSRFIFRANRPFIFVITDDSDLVLFMGVVVNPLP